MTIETAYNTARMSQCPSFDGCSAPKCPLDELQAQRVRLSGDPNCKANKKTRLLLGSDLPKRGLTGSEYQGVMLSHGSIEAYLRAVLRNFPLSIKDKTFSKGEYA